MSKKGNNFFEEHIEKIVLAVVGLVCIWLFLTRVLFSPNYVEYKGGKFSPSVIDERISTSKEAADLEEKLSSKPTPKSYERKKDIFVARLDSAISKVDVSVPWPLPIHSSMDINRGKYVIPEIGEVNEVTMGYIRTVAHVPTVEINEEVVYDKAVREVNDIDFVTVEAKFDVKGLYERWYDDFAGSDVQEEQWRDPCLANPVFAAVQLQRQEALADGSWSDWEIVPRTRIDHRKKMFEVIEDVAKLPPGGMKVRLLQFDDRVVRMDLLQPRAYSIASAREEWFPPSVHKKFQQHMREREMEEKRRAKEEEEEERERERDERSDLRRTRRPGAGSGFGTGGRSGRGISEGLAGTGGLYGGTDTTRRRTARSGSSGRRSTDDGTGTGRRSAERLRRRTDPGLGAYENYLPGMQGDRAIRRGPSMNDVYNEFYKILLTRRTLLEKMREPLVFWAHDDTVEPEKRYRYRIRLGVFNPIAGTNQFSEGYKGFKNKVVLWSEFSDITEAVEVPGRLYFFARDIQNEAAKIVTVQVSRYVLGYWHSKDFAVEQGEVIGKVVESETTSGSSRRRETAPEFFGGYPAAYGGYRGDEELRVMGRESDIRSSDIIGRTVPEAIDYTTGAVLVDVIAVNDWSGGKKLNPRHYFDMLYTFDGTNVERMPIRTKYWAKDVLIKFNEIKNAEKEPREPFRDWGSRMDGSAPGISMPGSEEDGYDNRGLPFRPAPRRR